MEKKYRLRAPNFTNSDSSLLCDIISKHKHVIENKRTDGANLLQKQRAWLEVAKEFNSITTGYTHTVESLQQNYKNLKKKAKKNVCGSKMDIPVDKTALIQNIEEYGTSSEGWDKVAESTGVSKDNCQEIFRALSKEADQKSKVLKKKIMGTGGGPPPTCDDDPLLEKVKGLVGPSIDGLYTIYDGDSSLMALQDVLPIEFKNATVIDSTTYEKPDEENKNHADEPTLPDPCHSANETLKPEKCQDDDKLVTKNLKNQPHDLLAYELPVLDPSQFGVETPKTHKSQDEEAIYFTNNRANLKKKPHDLLTRKRKLMSHIPEKQTVSEKFKILAADKMEYVALQKELLNIQLLDARETYEHNRLLRSLEVEDARAKYAHNQELRRLELNKYKTY